MFTQCPDCQTTFRVSAEVLQKAQGRVRCGGCGNAFNALEHLFRDDSKPDSQPVGKPDSQPVGKPDSIENQASSASDQTRQLLETLDKLAGPEVELEDTGVEWRVLEKPGLETIDPDSTGSMKFVLEDDENISESPAVHGRQSDLPAPPPGAQVPLDLPERDPPRTKPLERRYDDNTILPDDFGGDNDPDELPFLEAAAPKRRTSDRESVQDTTEFDEVQVDLALGDPDEWVDLLDEVADETGAAVAADASAEDHAELEDEPEPAAVEADAADDEPAGEDMPSDIDTQFLLQAEEMGIDTGNHPIVGGDDDEEEAAMLDETDLDLLDSDDDEDEQEDETEFELSLEDDEDADEDDDEVELESTGEFQAQIKVAEKALEGEDDQSDISGEEIEELAELDIEEELTAPGSIAGQTEDTSATMIGGRDVSELFKQDSALVETIVMEGDLIGDSINQRHRLPRSAARAFEDPGPLEDTYSLSRGKAHGGRRAGDPAGFGVIAGVAVLALLLIGQIMHQSRQSLATFGAFNQTVGSIYRALGKPITPEWDIRGWRFEATNGNVDEAENLLTIYSRIANKSSQALPYPLIHISLTDRWEDVIGSRALEPNQYLAGDLDPRKPVPPGENFTAVITIESPSADATGFRLSACYRMSPGRMRCADEHFKD